MWSSSLLPSAFARAFEPPPAVPIWRWAEDNVWLENKEAAESGPYRSAKTPWTRRLQELMQRPEMFIWDAAAGRYVTSQVNEIDVEKSSQSGYSEGCLNGIRWKARYRPCNTIYAIDTREEAKNISERLLPSLGKLDGNIFTGDDDDVGTYTVRLRAMDLWFFGSFSTGKFANKQAPLVIADELEEHGQQSGDTSSARNLSSRKKTAPNGLQINLSKPKKKNGPIDKLFRRGNREEYHVPCPHCGHMQPLTFFPGAGLPGNKPGDTEYDSPFSAETVTILDEQTGAVLATLPVPLPPGQTRRVRTGRLVFEHCKDLLGEWDKLRILRETYYECGNCQGRIDEHRKQWMNENGGWIPTALGTPGVVSQHINDLYSTDPGSRWGVIVLEYLDAKKEGRKELQGFYNHRLGIAWRDEAAKIEEADIRLNIAGREGDRIPPYKRGVIPFVPSALILGSDVGGNYARWSLIAVLENLVDAAVIDWGDETGPEAIAEIMLRSSWPCLLREKPLTASYGFMDAKFRKTDCYRACLSVPGRRLIPCAGLGGSAARIKQLWGYGHVQGYPKTFKLLSFNDREAKDGMYVECLKKKIRRIFFPVDVFADPQFVKELTAEELIDDGAGGTKWNEHPGPNHYGDSVKLGITGLRFLTRKQRNETETSDPAAVLAQAPPADPAVV